MMVSRAKVDDPDDGEGEICPDAPDLSLYVPHPEADMCRGLVMVDRPVYPPAQAINVRGLFFKHGSTRDCCADGSHIRNARLVIVNLDTEETNRGHVLFDVVPRATVTGQFESQIVLPADIRNVHCALRLYAGVEQGMCFLTTDCTIYVAGDFVHMRAVIIDKVRRRRMRVNHAAFLLVSPKGEVLRRWRVQQPMPGLLAARVVLPEVDIGGEYQFKIESGHPHSFETASKVFLFRTLQLRNSSSWKMPASNYDYAPSRWMRNNWWRRYPKASDVVGDTATCPPIPRQVYPLPPPADCTKFVIRTRTAPGFRRWM